MTIINCVHIIFNGRHKYRNVSTTNVLFLIGQRTHITFSPHWLYRPNEVVALHFAFFFASGKINLTKTQRNSSVEGQKTNKKESNEINEQINFHFISKHILYWVWVRYLLALLCKKGIKEEIRWRNNDQNQNLMSTYFSKKIERTKILETNWYKCGIIPLWSSMSFGITKKKSILFSEFSRPKVKDIFSSYQNNSDLYSVPLNENKCSRLLYWQKSWNLRKYFSQFFRFFIEILTYAPFDTFYSHMHCMQVFIWMHVMRKYVSSPFDHSSVYFIFSIKQKLPLFQSQPTRFSNTIEWRELDKENTKMQ